MRAKEANGLRIAQGDMRAMGFVEFGLMGAKG